MGFFFERKNSFFGRIVSWVYIVNIWVNNLSINLVHLFSLWKLSPWFELVWWSNWLCILIIKTSLCVIQIEAMFWWQIRLERILSVISWLILTKIFIYVAQSLIHFLQVLSIIIYIRNRVVIYCMTLSRKLLIVRLVV